MANQAAIAWEGGKPASRNQKTWPTQKPIVQTNIGWTTCPQDYSRAAPSYGAGPPYPNISHFQHQGYAQF